MEAGAATVYLAFVPPFGSEVEPIAGAGAAGDEDPRTAATPSPTEPTVFAVSPAAPLTGVTLLAGPDGPRLPRSMDVEISADGVTFVPVAGRRRRDEREDLRWVNGHPQYVIDHVRGPACIPGATPHWIGIVAPTLGDAVTACFSGPSGIGPNDPTARLSGGVGGTLIKWTNGSQAKMFGAYTPDDVERLRAGGNTCLTDRKSVV